MSTLLFIANLAAVVLFLALTVHAGLAGRRRRHFVLVGITLVLLFLVIYQAEIFGRNFEFEQWRLDVHLSFAFTTLATLPGVAWSGIGLARGRVRRLVHRRWVSVFVLLTVFAVITAVWMFLSATALPR